MFVTQRGLLYALPAGLLLLYHWRAKIFPAGLTKPRRIASRRLTLPFWIELILYASMPLFHIHTFIALSVVAAFFFLIGDKAMRKHFAFLVGAAFLPATFFVWSITDHFQARSVMKIQWGWVQSKGDFAAPFLGLLAHEFRRFRPTSPHAAREFASGGRANRKSASASKRIQAWLSSSRPRFSFSSPVTVKSAPMGMGQHQDHHLGLPHRPADSLDGIDRALARTGARITCVALFSFRDRSRSSTGLRTEEGLRNRGSRRGRRCWRGRAKVAGGSSLRRLPDL